jgi:hypothetical protein
MASPSLHKGGPGDWAPPTGELGVARMGKLVTSGCGRSLEFWGGGLEPWVYFEDFVGRVSCDNDVVRRPSCFFGDRAARSDSMNMWDACMTISITKKKTSPPWKSGRGWELCNHWAFVIKNEML